MNPNNALYISSLYHILFMLGSTKTKIQIQKWGWIGGKEFFIDKKKLRAKLRLLKERREKRGWAFNFLKSLWEYHGALIYSNLCSLFFHSKTWIERLFYSAVHYAVFKHRYSFISRSCWATLVHPKLSECALWKSTAYKLSSKRQRIYKNQLKMTYISHSIWQQVLTIHIGCNRLEIRQKKIIFEKKTSFNLS